MRFVSDVHGARSCAATSAGCEKMRRSCAYVSARTIAGTRTSAVRCGRAMRWCSWLDTSAATIADVSITSWSPAGTFGVDGGEHLGIGHRVIEPQDGQPVLADCDRAGRRGGCQEQTIGRARQHNLAGDGDKSVAQLLRDNEPALLVDLHPS